MNNKDWTGNSNSVWKTLGASNHTDKERESLDYYATNSVALDKLAPVFPIHAKVWECACGGRGDLSKWLVDHGHDVLSTDIADRGYGISGVDFLKTKPADIADWFAKDNMGPSEPFDILTNPPYSQAVPFVLHAIDLIPEDGHVIMFLKTTFLEGKQRKRLIYDVNPPRYVFQFSERVLCAKNGNFDYMKRHGGSAVAYCWMLFNKHNDEHKTEIKWI